MSAEFLRRITAGENRLNIDAKVLLDTNVIAEIDTQSDAIRLAEQLGPEEALRSPTFRYRQLRARHSILLARWLAKTRTPAGGLGNEAIDLVTGKLATVTSPMSLSVAQAIYKVFRPLVWQGWSVGALVNVNHDAVGTDADNELLRVATVDRLPIITWEGFTERGLIADRKKLRDKCIARGVAVYTPHEFLIAQNANLADETQRFLFSLDKAMRIVKSRRLLEGTIVDVLVPWFRLVLLDEVDPKYARIPRPA